MLKMSKMTVVALIVAWLTCIGCSLAHADNDPWDTTDKVLFGTYIGLQVIDIAQTNKIKRAETCDTYQNAALYPGSNAKPQTYTVCRLQYYEQNPIFGHDPNMTKVIAWKTFDVALVGLIAELLPSSLRKAGLFGADIFQFNIDHHNYTVGLKLGF